MTKGKRSPLRWLAEEYLAVPPVAPTTEDRFAALEAEMQALERRIKALGESVSHGFDEAS